MKIKELLVTEDKWIKGALAKKDGIVLRSGFLSTEADQFCLLGAAECCYSYEKVDTVIDKMETKINEFAYNLSQWRSISEFNDDPDTTFEMVRSLVTELDI